MSEKRRDHRGRILHNGEIQLSDGRYRFKLEKYSYLMADIDLSMSMRWERSAAYIAGA